MILLTGGRFGRGIATATVVVAALITLGCPTPIDMSVAEQLSDGSLPFVSVTSPEDGEVYSQTVTVSGTAQDADGEIRFLTYVVSGTLGVLLEDSPDVTTILSEDTFEFTFSTVGFTGPIELRVTVTDWNDNTASDSISLQYSGSQLSSFTAEPGNKSVTLDWEALPEADSYTIYYTDNGTLPSGSYGSSVDVTEVGYELTGLANGALHTFVLSANADGEPIFWSNYIRSIPLSPFTLAPRVRGEYRKIELEWQEIAGAGEYEVYRATSPDGPYSNYTGTISGTSFTDTGISEGVWYYYKVKPALEGAELSTYNAARSVAIPAAANRVSSILTDYSLSKIAVSGNYAYAAAGSGGMIALSIAEPDAPVEVGSVSTTDAADIETDGSYAYVADRAGGIRIIDVSNPASPAIVASYTGETGTEITDARHLALDTSNSILFVIDRAGGTTLFAIDVSTPATPVTVDSHEDASYLFKSVAVNAAGTDSYVYVVGSNSLLEYPFTLNTFGTAAVYTPAMDEYVPQVVATDGTSIYTISKVPMDLEPPDELQLYTFSGHPSAFANVGKSEETGETISGYAADLTVIGSRVYVVDEFKLHLYDTTDLTDPEYVYSIDTPGRPTGVAATSATMVCLASGTRSFQTVDMNVPGTPTVIGEYVASGVSDVRTRDGYAYVTADTPDRLQVLNVRDLTVPVAAGEAAIDGANGLALTGEYVVVAAGSAGLKIVDIADPSAPAVAGEIGAMAGYLSTVDVKGDYAFAAGSAGLEIFDIADPTSPQVVGIIDADYGGMNDIIIRGGIAYVIDGSYFQRTTLKVVDIADPTQAFLKDEADGVATSLEFFAVSGSFAYITDALGGMLTVNIDSTSGDYLSKYGPVEPDGANPSADGIAVESGYAFVGTTIETSPGTYTKHVAVLDVSDPTNPKPIGYSEALSQAPQLSRLYGEHLFVSTADGLRILQLQ